MGNFAKPDISNFKPRRSHAVYPNQSNSESAKQDSVTYNKPKQELVQPTSDQACNHKGHFQVVMARGGAIKWCTNCGKSWKAEIFNSRWFELYESYD